MDSTGIIRIIFTLFFNDPTQARWILDSLNTALRVNYVHLCQIPLGAFLCFKNFLGRVFKVKDVYTENGYKNRQEYLQNLSEEHGVDFVIVQELAALLGPSEDFDGLVSSLEDLL